ncbi:EF-hand domain pair domain-containing protein [Ditylenchus destructor]|uniref:EF-hand domain pair domain-containing protein n=1 Tax=Ditylenchus destructor TaxID=166010 RepID=A0AAD4NAK2_9BILA|nr:EF-hand domain pair domain-containing protein [Ditylenchus destructor]
MKNLWIFHLAITFTLLIGILCPPPNRQNAEEAQASNAQKDDGKSSQTAEEDSPYKFPYSKYLELVVKILESQPKFQERIRQMNEDEIKTGKIADHLDDLDNEVFDQLTKAKISEIERLREEIQQQIQREGDARNIKMPEHLDVNDWEKFTKEDLRKLIVKTVADMNEIDEERKEKFKQYEMEKKAKEDHRLAQLSEEERLKELKENEEAKKRHDEHEKLKHPGGREQLEEVWEERDHMDKQAFDPKAFFALHDLNGDGFWNDEELEALFQVELEKVYNETNPDDDPKERIEEMYRMREHVVKQMDKNGDRMISLEEFLKDSEAQDANKPDEGWDDLGKQKIYTEEELKKFEDEYARQQGYQQHPGGAQPPPQPPIQVHNQQPPAQELNPAASSQQQTDNAVPPQQKIHKVDPVYGI